MAEDAAAGKMSAKQMGARAEMYLDGSTQAFERGKAASYSSGLDLPDYPATGAANVSADAAISGPSTTTGQMGSDVGARRCRSLWRLCQAGG